MSGDIVLEMHYVLFCSHPQRPVARLQQLSSFVQLRSRAILWCHRSAIVPKKIAPGDPDVLFAIHEQIVDRSRFRDVSKLAVTELDQIVVRPYPESSVIGFGKCEHRDFTQAVGQTLK